MQLRKAVRNDAPAMWAVRTAAIRGIGREYYSQEDMIKWSPEQMPASFPEMIEKFEWLVIEADGDIVATGALDTEKQSIEAIFVKPKHQGKGFAKQILDRLEDLAKARDFKKVTLESTLSAEVFYNKSGYRSLEKSKYISPSGLTLDCIKMEKYLR